MTILRVLHISDLHSRPAHAFAQQVIVDGLLRDVERFQRDREFDLVVFSGDLAFAGKAEEFATGRRLLLNPLMLALGLDASRLVLVPGNHDVDLTRIDEIYEDGLAKRLTNRDAVDDLLNTPEKVEAATARLAAWRHFLDVFYPLTYRDKLPPDCWTVQLTIQGVQVGIAALNSAWRSTGLGDAERGFIIIGDRPLITALQAIAATNIRLVVVHHPFEWLTVFDSNDARRELERAGTIVLTGHEHVAAPSLSLTSRGSAIYARAGCLYETRDYVNSYSVLDFDTVSSQVDCYMRTWWSERSEFDAAVNVVEAGRLSLPLPMAGSHAMAIPYGDVTTSLVSIIQRTSVIADLVVNERHTSVADLLVPPRFYPAPFAELIAANRSRGTDKIQEMAALDMLGQRRVLLVCGEPESGVTSALVWLLGQRYAVDAARIPIYIRFSDRQGARVVEEDLRDAIAKIGVRRNLGEPLPPAVIAVDDVSASSVRATRRLVQYISEHRENLYILGCHGDEHQRILDALRDQDVGAERTFLGPLGRREMRALVNKVLRGRGSDAADKIWEVLAENRLPRSPFLIAALAAVMASQPEAVSFSATAIVDAYVDLLLGRGELQGLAFLDYRRREHLLEHFAGWLIARDVLAVDRSAAEEMVGNYFRARGDRQASAGRVIDGLLQRRILLQDGDMVGFRHPVLLHLFGAKLMNEDVAYADQFRHDIIKHREIVRHAAALSRSDRVLLQAAGEAVDAIVASTEAELTDTNLDELLTLDITSASTSPEDLEEQLRSTAPPPPDVMEARLDELYERFPSLSAGEHYEPSTDFELARDAWDAVRLLSDVVVSSELVDDVDLKVRLLQHAIHGWGVAGLALLVQEKKTGHLHALFESMLEEEEADRARSDTEVDESVRLALMINVLVGALASLTSKRTQSLLLHVLGSDKFMDVSVHALVATVLACVIRMGDWPRRLVDLYRTHRDHPFVRDLAYLIALSRYQSPRTIEAEALVLENFLIDVAEEGSSRADLLAPGGRPRLRSRIQGQLKKSRAQARMIGAPTDVLQAPGDEPNESDDGTSGG